MIKRQRFLYTGAITLLGMVSLTGCNELTGRQPLPAGTNDPSFYSTPTGAVEMRNTAIYAVTQALPQYITDTGLLTDELESNQTGASTGVLLSSSLPFGGSIDERILPELSSGGGTEADADYANLQGVRGSVNQALGALAAYDTLADAPSLRGELYALQGYAEILLADLFCSGVPLSTFDFQHDFTYSPSSTTAQVYQDAVGKEDSALALAGGNDTITNLARVLQGRALLAAGKSSQAAQIVSSVPDGFQYQLAVTWDFNFGDGVQFHYADVATIADGEGGNGLPYLSSGDPRTSATVSEFFNTPNPVLFPAKYSVNGYSQFTVADWIEARLIQAEAALQAHDTVTWLTTLNHLRKTATVPGQTVAPLDTLVDPGPSSGDALRIALTFQERAYWLFLTGHRQGDLRRLVRQYGPQVTAFQSQNLVYPTGPYSAPGAGQYGSDVTAPIPASERANPHFHGCLSRGA